MKGNQHDGSSCNVRRELVITKCTKCNARFEVKGYNESSLAVWMLVSATLGVGIGVLLTLVSFVR